MGDRFQVLADGVQVPAGHKLGRRLHHCPGLADELTETALGEFLLPYEAVRSAEDPDEALLAFLQTTYEAAADRAGWDRAALECEEGRLGQPRTVAP